jgi:hypothetical protein
MKIVKIIVALALLSHGCASLPRGIAHGDGLSLWRDGSLSKAALVEYVSKVTEEGSPDFIPVERRIAVFDLDGTLFCETDPTYFDWMMFEHRVMNDPSYSATEEQKRVVGSTRETGKYPPLGKERERIVSEAYRGLDISAYDRLVRDFMDEPEPGYPGLRRGDMFYSPMVQLVEYLVGKDFAVYVVSGSERMLVRALVRSALPVPPWRVIGSDSMVAAQGQNGEDGLFYLFKSDDVPVMEGTLIVKNLQMNKVSAIIREIGAKPVLAFGNSMTDASMANYVIGANEYRAAAFMVLCDDEERENGKPAKAAEMRRSCEKYGWTPISMRDDWTKIYSAQ